MFSQVNTLHIEAWQIAKVWIRRLVEPISPALIPRLSWRRSHAQELSHIVIDACVSKGSVALDIGATNGYFAHRFADLVGPTGRVHAFEPNPFWHRALLVLNRRSNVETHTIAASDANGMAKLRVPCGPKREYFGSLEDTARLQLGTCTTIAVETRRVDDVIANDSDRVAFIKCDVEGHELAVLRGAQRALRNGRPTVLVEIEQRHQQRDIGEIFQYFVDLGFVGYMLKAGELRPIGEFDVQRDQLSRSTAETELPAYVNEFLFVPAERKPRLQALSVAPRPGGTDGS